MKAAVVRFPGSNCDQDCHLALSELGFAPEYVWHKEAEIAGYDLIVLPGGFSYGDYLRCGAIARFSPVMQAVIQEARRGTPVLGICNGFQILCEAHLLPGALVRNKSLHFVCEYVHVRVESDTTPFTSGMKRGAVLRIPVAHGEGNYVADAQTLATLQEEGQVVLRYCDSNGNITDAANPNGATDAIAGICNKERNVFGLMPHPERACDERLGSTDGRSFFESLRTVLGSAAAVV